MSRERDVEARFVRAAARHGLLAEKWQGQDGNPDRLVFGQNGVLGLAEVKAPGGRATPRQAAKHEVYRARGFLVMVVSNDEEIATFIARMLARG